MSDPWDGILEDGEDILWQGRPDTRFAMADADMLPMIFGLIFTAFAMLWMAIAAIGDSMFWVFGLVHFSIGIAITGYAISRHTLARKYSYYTLTSSRAIIGLSYPWAKPSLRKRRITARTKIVLDPEHTVTFGPSGRSKRHPIPTRPPQFAHIDDAEKVFHLMQQIQKETS
jgi:hypothetical protein